MRTVALPGRPGYTSALGFGCSALVGGRTRAEAVRLLDAAFDAGIRHFDVARVYGTGDAEAAVGRFAARHPGEVTIATKFGIDPLPPTTGLMAAKRIVRFATRRSTALLATARRFGGSSVKRGRFTPEQARSSLETSLRELRTDRVDVYFLHDCSAADWEQAGLLAALEELQAEGAIGSFGPATSFAEAKMIVASPAPPATAQFEADVFRPCVEQLTASTHRPTSITQGCFRTALPALVDAVCSDARRAQAWSRALEADMSSTAEIARLLLASSLESNREGVVLFSSGDERRIEENARVAQTDGYDVGQLREFERLVRGLRTDLGPCKRR